MSRGTETRRSRHHVGVRLNDEEMQILTEWAESWAISIPELLRVCTFDSPYCPRKPSNYTGK